jgi:DNA-binding transcriptional LysR family regulator
MSTYPTVRELEVFLVVARKKSFKRAAKFLGMAPESVSLTIASLEKKCGGHQLIRRSGTATQYHHLTGGGLEMNRLARTTVRNFKKSLKYISKCVEPDAVRKEKEVCDE